MTRQMIAPLIFGLAGFGLLLWLGNWQLERHVWKQAILAEIDAQIGASPGALPIAPTPENDKFLAVQVSGRFVAREIQVLASNRDTGAGYRVISVLETDGRRILVDRGFIPIRAKNDLRPARDITLNGNLHWPDEVDRFTPEPDVAAEIWFARDVPALAAALDTEPVLIVARSDTGDGVAAFPMDSSTIPNNHLNYAITWFLMAVVWLGMTGFLLSRIKRQSNE